MNRFTFSVIIPTYRDNLRLNLCLKALFDQTFDRNRFEVIVVNNDTNGVIEIENFFFDELNLKVFDEKTPGSYSARNKGILNGGGRILAFTDSDCLPDKDWLNNAAKAFENDLNKEIGVLTGPIPLFFKDPHNLSAAEVYEKFTGFTTASYASEGKAVTANWFSYASVINEFGGFNSELKSNGDSELSGKISSKYKICFQHDIKVNHPARYSIEELVTKYKRLLGGTYKRKFEHKPLPFLKHLINFSFRRVKFSAKKFFTVPPQESWAIFVVCAAITLGAWKEYFFLIQGHETKR
jgi:glycosyltransferase involved in cell wall biosynthesis